MNVQPQSRTVRDVINALAVNILSVDANYDAEGLGSGSYASIYQGMHRVWSNGQPWNNVVAVKVIRRLGYDTSLELLWKRLEREVTYWKCVNGHTNIVPLLGVTPGPDANSFSLVMPFMVGGNLWEYLNGPNGKNADHRAFLQCIARGVQHVHACGMIHGDIKAHNILVDDRGTAYLSDFGTMGPPGVLVSTTLKRGTPQWMAPERISPSSYNMVAEHARTVASDIFSVGITIYEVLALEAPFQWKPEDGIYDVMHLIAKGTRPKRPGRAAEKRGLTKLLWHYMQLSWQPMRDLRPSIDSLLRILDGQQLPQLANQPVREDRPAIDPVFTALFRNSPILQVDVIKEPKDSWERPPQHGTVSDVLGGALASNGQLVAIKGLRMNKHGREVYEKIATMLKATINLRHRNIMPLRGVNSYRVGPELRFDLVYDWMNNGNLSEFLKDNPTVPHEPLLLGIAYGLQYLHKSGIVHGQLMPMDVLINGRRVPILRPFSMTLCIGDYLDLGMTTMAKSAAWAYMPPEIVYAAKLSAPRTKEIDMYSFGMMIYHLYFHRTPFYEFVGDELDPGLLRDVIMHGDKPNISQKACIDSGAVARGMSETLATFVGSCWNSEPGQRPTIGYFLKKFQRGAPAVPQKTK